MRDPARGVSVPRVEPEAAAPLVELANVRKVFGDNVVLDAVDLRIAAGEAIVVAGGERVTVTGVEEHAVAPT